jgi:hypothetical protein
MSYTDVSVIPLSQLRAAIAAAIRAACADPDDGQCVEDEDECFRNRPVHLAQETAGVIEMVYADVDGLADIVAKVVEEGQSCGS